MSKRRRVWSATFIVVAVWLAIFIPLCFPLGLPLYVSPMTREFRDYLDEVAEKEGIILHHCPVYAGSLRGTADVLKYCIKNKIKWVGWSPSPRGYAYTVDALKIAGAFKADEAETWVHGVDWLWLGYIPGGEAVHAGLADDFKKWAKIDYKGDSTLEYPLFQEIDSKAEIDLFIGSGEAAETWASLWPSVPERPTLVIICGDYFAVTIPYYPHLFKAILKGIEGAAELEYLIGMPGRAIAAVDALSGTGLVTIIVLIIAQIETLIGKRVERVIKVEES